MDYYIKYEASKDRGIEVFGSLSTFITWFLRYNGCLRKAPIECTIEDILTALGRLEHGIYC